MHGGGSLLLLALLPFLLLLLLLGLGILVESFLVVSHHSLELFVSLLICLESNDLLTLPFLGILLLLHLLFPENILYLIFIEGFSVAALKVVEEVVNLGNLLGGSYLVGVPYQPVGPSSLGSLPRWIGSGD